MPGEARGMRILLLGTCVISTCVSVRIERRLGGEGRPPRTRCSHGLSRCGYGAIRAAGPAEGFSECGILIRKRTEGVGAAWLTCEGGGSASPASAVASSAITSPIASSTVAHGRKHLWRRLGHRCRVNVSVRGTAAVAAAASAATAAASRRRPRPWSIRTRLWSVSTSRGLVATWQCQVDFLIVVPTVVVVVIVVVVVVVLVLVLGPSALPRSVALGPPPVINCIVPWRRQLLWTVAWTSDHHPTTAWHPLLRRRRQALRSIVALQATLGLRILVLGHHCDHG